MSSACQALSMALRLRQVDLRSDYERRMDPAQAPLLHCACIRRSRRSGRQAYSEVHPVKPQTLNPKPPWRQLERLTTDACAVSCRPHCEG